MVETKSFPLTDQTGMITVKNVDAGYLGFAVPYFMQLGQYFDREIKLERLQLKFDFKSGSYDSINNIITIGSFNNYIIGLNDILEDDEMYDISKKDHNMFKHEDKYIGMFSERYCSHEKFPDVLEKFNSTGLHELTHKYFNDFILSEKNHNELLVKLYKEMTKFEKKKGITVENFIINEKYKQPIQENYQTDVKSFIRDLSNVIRHARNKLPIGIRKLYIKDAKIIELNENLARAHVLAKLGIYEKYDDWGQVFGYMIHDDYDIRIGNLEIKRLSKKIQKTGLRSTMETEYQKIMGKPSKKVAT